MRFPQLIKQSLFCVTLLLIASPLAVIAQSSMERELELLKEQRAKTVAATVDPINRRYQEGLTKLIDRATQAKDLETALKIKEELSLPAYDGATSGTSKSGSIFVKADDPVSKLPTTSWYWGPNKTMKFTFLRDGRFSGHLKGATWRPVSPDLIYYSWGGKAYTGVMRVPQGFERLDAAEWQGGTPVAPAIVLVLRAD